MIVDGAVVMVENIFRQLARAARHASTRIARGRSPTAAAEVDRPIVYAIAVIIAGFLPIYVLSGPSGRLFRPMADTTIFALVGALLLTLTLLPVLCAVFLRGGVQRAAQRRVRMGARGVRPGARLVPRASARDVLGVVSGCSRVARC